MANQAQITAVLSTLPAPQTGKIYNPRGIFNFTATQKLSTSSDYLISSPLIYLGATLYCVNAMMGDTIDFYLVDKDNIVGLGATPLAPITLMHIARAVSVFPSQVMTMPSESPTNPLPVGLYLRLTYNSNIFATQDVSVALNMHSYMNWSDFILESAS